MSSSQLIKQFNFNKNKKGWRTAADQRMPARFKLRHLQLQNHPDDPGKAAMSARPIPFVLKS